MAIVNRIAEFSKDMKEWRHHLHQNPELGFECYETADFVARKLREFGVDEIHEGIATTGIVAIINGRDGGAAQGGPTIGLRADMDALPMAEETGLSYASKNADKMHACGHDGHTTMLLGAARYLAETRKFSGRVALIFQPAEEGGGGGQVMCQEGMIERFNIGEVYAIHNMPQFPVGRFGASRGAATAAADDFNIVVKGAGGHGAFPQNSRDPVVALVAIVQAFQNIVSRNHDTAKDLVVSVTQIHSGSADNIIPETGFISGTVRSFDKDVQTMVQRRMAEICRGVGESYEVEVDLTYNIGYPAMFNHDENVDVAVAAAQDVVGIENVDPEFERLMAGEDFSYMLEECKGAYLVLGQGEGEMVHNPGYNFNDEIAPLGASYFARLVEMRQPLGNG